jgi:hypothetical protein
MITFSLRSLITRTVLQFEYSKTLPWAKNINVTFIHQTFGKYMSDDTTNGRTWTQLIADGESGVYFLAGIFPAGSWVQTSREGEDDEDGSSSSMVVAARRRRHIYASIVRPLYY